MNNLSDTDNNRVEIEEEIVLSVSPAHFNQEENVSKKIIHNYFFDLSTFQEKIGLQIPDKNEGTVFENLTNCLTLIQIFLVKMSKFLEIFWLFLKQSIRHFWWFSNTALCLTV